MAKKVLLGVTGCIAAYKACEVLRALQREGFEVEVVMTAHAAEFVSPLAFSALSGAAVRTDAFGDLADAIPHIRLAEGCDAFLIAPCTANVIAKVASGIADDLLTSCALAAHDRLVIAPAMNVHMLEAPSTQANLRTLRERGVSIVEPGQGYLACGDVGAGRLADVDSIVGEVVSFMGVPATAEGRGVGPLRGMRVLVTAGPTIEWIDPVRYVSNPSTGKMGYAVAEAARDAGAEVVLVSGPCALDAPEGVEVVRVETAGEMLAAAKDAFDGCAIAVLAAAVSDFRPAAPAGRKLKKSSDREALQSIRMVENPDILATLAARKGPGQLVIGFAAETDDVERNARDKLASKGADMIVANRVGEGSGFGVDAEAAMLVTREGTRELPCMPKRELAAKIIEAACDNFKVC